MGFLALLLFGSIVSSGARSLARTHYQNDIIDAALGRQLLGAKGQREKEDNGPEAQVPAACRSSSGTKNDKWTTAGCGDGCQSCKTQPSSSGRVGMCLLHAWLCAFYREQCNMHSLPCGHVCSPCWQHQMLTLHPGPIHQKQGGNRMQW